jgi:hypothetical protein
MKLGGVLLGHGHYLVSFRVIALFFLLAEFPVSLADNTDIT